MSNACNCNCNDQYDLSIKLPNKFTNDQNRSKRIVNFGNVQVGHEKFKTFTIHNHFDIPKIYTLEFNPNAVQIYQFFKTSTKEFDLPANGSTTIKISYKPIIPWRVDHNVINIKIRSFSVLSDILQNSPSKKIEDTEDIRIEVTGKSIGPRMQISANSVRFNTWPSMQSGKKAVELRNLSAFPVEFKFDVDDAPMPIFDIVPHAGVVAGNRHVIVNITFRASTFGVYTQRFFCMIHNHPPLMIDCLGVHSKTNDKTARKIEYVKTSEKNENFYNHYMRDMQKIVTEKPAFSFSDAYLDFGSVDMKTQKFNSMVTSLTNHCASTILIKCHQDEFFQVTPAQIEVPANESVLYECNFRPTMEDNIYSRNLLFNVFLIQKSTDENQTNKEEESDEFKIETMPISGSLRVLGHSFDDTGCWIPQFVNPATVILPPVIPGLSTFSTLELRTKGFLPTSFQFLPPTASNYLLKPMMGTILGQQIIVVQLVSHKTENPKTYIEQWHIMLNNDKNHKIPICVKGYAALPAVEIGENNKITIQGVQIGCEEVVTALIRNCGPFNLFYEFMTCDLPEDVNILTTKGPLAPYASDTIKVAFKSSARVCKQFPVTCLVYPVRDLEQIYGSPVETSVMIIVEAGHSELCALPSEYDFGAVECHSSQSSEFRLFNYGHTTIHYKLSLHWRHSLEYYQNATVAPAFGTLQPKAHVHCGINFSPHSAGVHYVRAGYELRPDANSVETIHNTRKFIYQFRAEVIYPYIQIIEIGDHNFGPLFSARSLWESLNINWLNYALAEGRYNDDRPMCIDLNLPDAEMNHRYFYVTLMARNVTQFPVQVSLKRRKLCDCELQEVGAFLSIRQRVYQCPHREMCKFSIVTEQILPNCVHPMILRVNYFREGAAMLSYQLITNEKRFIILNFRLNSIGIDEMRLSKYKASYSFFLQPVCLRLKQEKLHVYWFYNNTNTPVSYELSTDIFKQINKNYRFEVWKCLNPIGTINEFAQYPLMIHFHPLEKKQVMLKIPMKISTGHTHELIIRARGSRSSIPNKIPKHYMPQTVFDEVPIHLSMDRLRIHAFPVWSSSTRLIFITNMSNDILGYNWFKTEIPGLCRVDVKNPNRVLRPKQTDVIIIQIKSFDKAFTTRVHLPCQLISHTKYLQHQKSMQDYQKREKEIQEEFIINDEGVSHPTNEIEILPKPMFFYKTLALELEIKSLIDRDTFYTPHEHFQQEPQLIFTPGFETLACKQNQAPISFLSRPIHPPSPKSSESSNNDDLYKEVNPYEFNPKVDNVGFYGKVVEALIADTIFSSRFQAVLNLQKRVPPIYYTQIRPQNENNSVDLETHLKNFYNEPQMPFVKEILHEMLLKSFEDMFKLKTKEHEKLIDYKLEVDLPNVCKCISKVD